MMNLLVEYYARKPDTKAKKILFAIVRDLTDHSGLSDEWGAIDPDIQNEILITWLEIIEQGMKGQ